MSPTDRHHCGTSLNEAMRPAGVMTRKWDSRNLLRLSAIEPDYEDLIFKLGSSKAIKFKIFLEVHLQ